MPDEQVQELSVVETMRQRNEAEANKGKVPVAPKVAEKAAEPTVIERIPRSKQREINRLRESAAEERGRRLALEEMMPRINGKVTENAPAQETKVPGDPEPQRKDFPDDAAYNRALGRWDAREETRKELAKEKEAGTNSKQVEEFRAHVAEMDKKATEDVKLIEDWKDVAEKAMEEAEDDPSLQFSIESQPTFMMLLYQSDVRAFVTHHFAKNPDELRDFLKKKPEQQIAAFHRLEGRVEKMYTSPKAAQAGDKSKDESKDRNLPEKAEQARATAVDREVHKPRPSSEVAARGGTATPEEPKTGSPAWMAARNQRQFGR